MQELLFRKYCSCLFAFCLIAFVCSSVFAAVGYNRITAPETKRLLQTEGEALLVMVLSQLEFELHHIPGSVNIPINKMEKSSLLPTDKSNPLIFYCMGVR